MKRLPILLLTILLGCATPPEPPVPAAEQGSTASSKSDAPRYVAFSRLSPIYLEPNESAPYVLYRTEDEQAERLRQMEDERRAADERHARRAEKHTEREEKRAKRVRKRMRRLRGERRERYREKEEERQARRARAKAEAALERVVEQSRKDRGEAPHEHVVIARLVDEEAGWVGIRPISHDTPRCYAGGAPSLSNIDAKLWVKRDALFSVVTERVRVPVAHGTEVILAPGVAVDRRNGSSRALVNGFQLGLEIPENALAESYEAGRMFEAPFTETVFAPNAFNDRLLRLSQDAALPYNPWFPLHVTATLYVGDRFYATTQTPCAEFTVRTVEEALEPVGKRDAMRVGGSAPVEVTPPMFVAGAKIHTPSGDPIGSARADIPVISELDNASGLECWHFEVWPGSEGVRRLPICTRESDFRGLTLTDGL